MLKRHCPSRPASGMSTWCHYNGKNAFMIMTLAVRSAAAIPRDEDRFGQRSPFHLQDSVAHSVFVSASWKVARKVRIDQIETRNKAK